MKKTVFVFLGIAAFLLASCASSGNSSGGSGSGSSSSKNAIQPPEITKWQQDNPNAMNGVGISTFEDESDAYMQASALARADLAQHIEVEVGAITENYIKRSQVGEDSDKAMQFKSSTKQMALQTISNSRTYGPFMNNRGSTYVLIYLDNETKARLERNIHKEAEDVLGDQIGEMNELMGTKN